MPGNFRMKRGSHVAIGVEGERDRAVAEKLLNHLWTDASIQQMRGRGLPQVVDSDSTDSRLLEGSTKRFARPGSVDWPSDG